MVLIPPGVKDNINIEGASASFLTVVHVWQFEVREIDFLSRDTRFYSIYWEKQFFFGVVSINVSSGPRLSISDTRRHQVCV